MRRAAPLSFGLVASLILLALWWAPPREVPPAWAQGVGIFSRATCSQIASAVQGQSFCFEQNTNTLKFWNGATWTQSNATQSGVNNVLDFGADPTGISDSAPAIQAALNVALTLGQTVYIPQGTYRLSTGLTTLGGSKIMGAGRPYTRLRYYGTGGSALRIGPAGYHHTYLSDFTLENSGTGTTVGIDIFWTFVNIERLTIGAFDAGTTGFTTGVRYNNINGKTFENQIMFSYILQNATGVELNNTDYTLIQRSRLENNLVNVRLNNGTGFAMHQTDSVGDFTINGAGHIGVDVGNYSAWAIRDSQFETDLSQSGVIANAVAIRMGATPTAANGVIEGNWLNGSGSSDILINATTSAGNINNVRISDNYFYRATWGIKGPSNLMRSLYLGPNYAPNNLQLLNVNDINDGQASYSTYNGLDAPHRIDPPLLLATSTSVNATNGDLVITYGRGVRGVSSGGTNTFEMLARKTMLGAGEGVAVGGAGDFVAIGGPIRTDGAAGGDAIFRKSAWLRWSNAADSTTVTVLRASPTTDNVAIGGGLGVSTASPSLLNVRSLSGTLVAGNNLRGSCTFAGAATCAVAFASNEPDANYFIQVTQTSGTTVDAFRVSSKAVSGFTINASQSNSNAVDWLLVR